MSGTTTEEDEAFLKMDKHAQQCFHLARGEKGSSVYVNPVVTITSFVMIWIFVIVCVIEPDRMLKAMNIVASDWIPEVWTWFYIVSQNIWIVVLLYMCFSKAGDLKLGKDDDKPEYSFATWFSMLFSAGVAVGLFYYSVYEPVAYYKKGRWESVQRGYGNDNEDATHAMMVTWFHWGLHGWIPYTTMGAIMALMSYRRGFPMTVRYCLWPLIGDRCYGWMGDAIDILSVVTTIFGVCTSLGLGAMQVNQGLQRLNHGFYRGTNYAIPTEEKFSTPTCGGTGSACADGKESYGIQVNTATQIVIIIVITVLATTSVASGVNKGIVTLSRINFALGMFICLTVLFIGETYFILDVIVQTAGYYIWYIWKIAFQTDAYERLGGKSLGLGGAPDGLGGTSGWLGGWTLFYWGWWISWAPFVGIFLAKISKGRTLRQFIVGTLIIPSVYSFFWFGVFGAEGIRMQRMADGSGLCSVKKASDYCSGGEKEQLASSCGNFAAQFSTADKTNLSMGWTPKCVLDPSYHDGFGRCKQFAWTRYVEVGEQCVKSTKWVDVPCGGTTRRLVPAASCTSSSNNDPTQLEYGCLTGPCKNIVTEDLVKPNSPTKMYNLFPPNDQPKCFVPAQNSLVCLSQEGITDVLFDVIGSYGPRGFTDLLNVITLVALVCYFVTSSDSGSLVVDIISANGHTEPPLWQRILWSCTEGATACALLAAGRNLPNSSGSLQALQSASLVTGLPYTVILFWAAQSLYLCCKEEAHELEIERKAFKTFVIPIPDIFYDTPYLKRILVALVLPGFTMGKIISKIKGWPLSDDPDVAKWFWCIFYQSIYVTEIILLLCSAALYQWCILALVIHCGFAGLLGFLRTHVRVTYKIQHGDMLTDFICSFFVPFFTLAQMEFHVEEDDIPAEVQNAVKV